MRQEPGGSAARRPAPAPRSAFAAIGDGLTAVSYVRFFQPFEHLAGLGWSLRTLGGSLTLTRSERGYAPDARLLEGAALLVFPQMVAAPRLPGGERVHIVEPLCEAARRFGARIVYSVDDHVAGIEPGNPSFGRIRAAERNLATILANADAVIATTEHLARSLEGLGVPCHVIPNAVDPGRWRARPRRGGGPPRIGWAGSSSHLEDLLMVLPALERLRRRVPFRLVLYGIVDTDLREQARRIRSGWAGFDASQRETARAFLELHGTLTGMEHVHVPFGPLETFFRTLPDLDLDIGLCPLRDTGFNRHKSALKFYEYAVTGSLTVASDVPPYRDEVTPTVPEDAGAWCEVLERYLRDPEAREREAAAQRAWVLEHRDIRTLRHRWAETLDAIVEGR